MSSANGTSASAAVGPVQCRLRANAGAKSRPRIATPNAAIASAPTRPAGTASGAIIGSTLASGAAAGPASYSPPKIRASSNGDALSSCS